VEILEVGTKGCPLDWPQQDGHGFVLGMVRVGMQNGSHSSGNVSARVALLAWVNIGRWTDWSSLICGCIHSSVSFSAEPLFPPCLKYCRPGGVARLESACPVCARSWA
jgi:hypothetical protein